MTTWQGKRPHCVRVLGTLQRHLLITIMMLGLLQVLFVDLCTNWLEILRIFTICAFIVLCIPIHLLCKCLPFVVDSL